MRITSWEYFTSWKSILYVNETWIHLNLKTIEILDKTQKINRYSKSIIETLEEDVICSKLTITQWSDDLLLLGYR